MWRRFARSAFWGSVGLVLYTYFGYPALMALWARLRPRPPRSSAGHTPSVSLIIVAFNEETCIADKIANSFALDYPADRLELIVAADGSSDATAAIAAADPRVKLLHTPERAGKMAAMNRAAAHATGEILVFSDANNYYPPQTLRAVVAPFADAEVGLVTGRKQISDESGRPLDKAEGLYWRYERSILTWESQVGSVTAACGEILAVRREAFRPMPTRATVNDDFVLAIHTALDGWRLAYAPEALSLEPASATLGDETRRRSRIVTGRVLALWELLPRLARRNPQLAWQLVSHKALRPLVPVAMIVAALTNLLLAPASAFMAAVAALQALFYASALAGWRNERGGRRSRRFYIPYYFCRVNLAQLQGIGRLRLWRQAVLYEKVQRSANERLAER
jgi:biofilm PGA synthesis N-glycosyltransferase PgaC